MTITELKELAQDLLNERNEFERKADYAQDCLNTVHRKIMLMELEAQQDTPMGEAMGG